MDGWWGNPRRGFLSYRAVIPRAHFIILDRLAGRPVGWHEMRLIRAAAFAMLFHNLEWRL